MSSQLKVIILLLTVGATQRLVDAQADGELLHQCQLKSS